MVTLRYCPKIDSIYGWPYEHWEADILQYSKMSFIKQKISSALGSNQVKTGFNGPQLPFVNDNKISQKRRYPGANDSEPPAYDSIKPRADSVWDRYESEDDIWECDASVPHCSKQVSSRRERYDMPLDTQAGATCPPPSFGLPQRQSRVSRRGFRTMALPQIAYGDGQPFLRAYSDELRCRGISMEIFIAVLDDINVAIIPNPEVQIFQKTAKIAGFFV